LARSRDEAERLLDVHLRGGSEIHARLMQFVRKQDYVHRDESILPEEAGAWHRAVNLLVGEQMRGPIS
jgi:hypothetical protein